jgi:prephenate dehydrogenase
MAAKGMTRMLILGGTGETGSWFARYFRDKSFDVAVWGPSGKTGVAASIGVRYAADMIKEAEQSDIVLLSVPIEKTVEVIRQEACSWTSPPLSRSP